MAEFIVSARKYRPGNFSSVVGQGHVVRTLENAIRNDQLAHAFLFCGPRGVGKTTCARILAKIINSPDPVAALDEDLDADQGQGEAMHIQEVDAASNNSVEDIRRLTEQVRFPPQSGKYKVYIIDEVHMLSQAAFNAFLKTLEEPPPYAIFILATTEKHKVIPTILSRCQIYDFKRIGVRDIAEHLKFIAGKESLQYDEEGLYAIARKADGALRDALSLFDRILSYSAGEIRLQDVLENLHILDYDYFFDLTDALLSEDVATVLKIYAQILERGFEGDVFISGLAQHFRDLLVAADPGTLDLLERTGKIKQRYQEQAVLAPQSFLISGLQILNECDVQYRMARNKRLQVEMTLIKLCYLQRVVQQVALPEGKKNPSSKLKETPKPESKKEASDAPVIEEAKSEPKPEPKAKVKAEPIAEPEIKAEPAAELEAEIAEADNTETLTAESAPAEELKTPAVESLDLKADLSPELAIEAKQEEVAEKTVEAAEEVEAPAAAPAQNLFGESIALAEKAKSPEPEKEKLEIEKPRNVSANWLPDLNDLGGSEENQEAEDAEDFKFDASRKPSAEQLQIQWTKYGKQIAGQRMAISKLVEASKILLNEDYSAVVQVNNIIQLDLMREELVPFREFLEAAGYSIRGLKLEVAEQLEKKTSRQPYTAQDRLKEMAKKNPAILDLKDQLGLETEF